MEKDASRILREGDLDRNPYDIYDPEGYDRLAAGAVLFASIFKVSFHQLSGSRSKNNTAFEFVTDFDLNDDTMLYASIKSGFKPGGYDVRSNSEPVPGSTGAGTLFPVSSLDAVVNNVDPGSFEFDDESALAYEVGSKLTLLDGTAELNIALFLTNFDDLQVSIFDGTLGFNVGNAAKATTKGVEIDGRWSISEDWYLTGSLGLLDFEFDNFKNGQCAQGELPTYPTNLPPDDPNYANRGKCDYTGKTNQYVADWSGSVGLNYEHPVTETLLFRSGLDVLFTDRLQPLAKYRPPDRAGCLCHVQPAGGHCGHGPPVGSGDSRAQPDGRGGRELRQRHAAGLQPVRHADVLRVYRPLPEYCTASKLPLR